MHTEPSSPIPVPPGLVSEVAEKVYESFVELTEVTFTPDLKAKPANSMRWDSVPADVQECFRHVARQAIATALTTLHREGWTTRKPTAPPASAPPAPAAPAPPVSADPPRPAGKEGS